MSNYQIDWEKVNGLLPVVVQEEQTNEVLMVAYMNKEAYELTLKTRFAHYFSRSKQRIWKKGESSGNVQKVKEVYLDCDDDTLLLTVEQVGGIACHTGRKSCFFKRIDKAEDEKPILKDMSEVYDVVDTLYHTILERKSADPKSSYVSKLLHGKENSMLKKVAEEASEFCFAVKDDDKDEIVYEAADLLFHSLVALGSKDISPELVKNELKRRFGTSGIEEKNSRNVD